MDTDFVPVVTRGRSMILETVDIDVPGVNTRFMTFPGDGSTAVD